MKIERVPHKLKTGLISAHALAEIEALCQDPEVSTLVYTVQILPNAYHWWKQCECAHYDAQTQTLTILPAQAKKGSYGRGCHWCITVKTDAGIDAYKSQGWHLINRNDRCLVA